MSDKVAPAEHTLVEILLDVLRKIAGCPYCAGCKENAQQAIDRVEELQREGS